MPVNQSLFNQNPFENLFSKDNTKKILIGFVALLVFGSFAFNVYSMFNTSNQNHNSAPTREELVTTINNEINVLDLEIIAKTDARNDAQKKLTEAQRDLDEATKKRGDKFKEKDSVMNPEQQSAEGLK